MKVNHDIDDQKLEGLLKKVFQEDLEKEKKQEIFKKIIRKNKKKSTRRKIILIGSPFVAIAAILVLWFALYNPSHSFDSEEFYTTHFQPDIRETSYRGSDVDQNQPETALNQAQMISTLHKAMQAMRSENWDEAEALFIQLIPLGGSIQIESLWYLSLIYLKTEDLPKCKTYLKDLIDTKDPTYRKPARELLRVID